MKNLLDAVIHELDNLSSAPLERTGSTIVGSPRGAGGSRKRILKKPIRKTLRKTYRT